MRRVMVALAFATAAVALAAPTGAAAAERTSVVGSATNTFEGVGVNALDVHAALTRTGAVVGTAHGDGDLDGAGPMGPFGFTGKVTCLRVVGNHASLKYQFDTATGSGSGFAGGGVEVYIEDNGRPVDGAPVDANATDPPQPAGVFQLNASQCDDPTVRPDYNPVDTGDYTVRS